jgi:hypothetical protein
MKLLKGILITALLYSASVFSGNAVATAQMGGPGHMGYPGYNNGNGNFKVADLDLDGVNEIILFEGSVLIVMDNKGNVLFSKTVNLTGYYPYENRDNGNRMPRKTDSCPGYDDYYDDDDLDDDDDYNYDDYYYHMGGSGFDVANLDEDKNPEIIIMDYNSLLVLDNNGNKKYTIELPLVVSP